MEATLQGTENLVGEAPTPNGLKAPAVTTVLTAADLAKICSEEDDEQPIDRTNHGAIDQVDSELITQLQQKLTFAQGPGSSQPSQPLYGDAFNTDLAEALAREDLARGLAEGTPVGQDSCSAEDSVRGILAPSSTMVFSDNTMQQDDQSQAQMAQINDKLLVEVQQKLTAEGSLETPDALPTGMLAPQNTTKISADMLRALGDDDEDEDASQLGVIDLNLVSELQRKLEGGGVDSAGQGPTEGCRAPQTTVKLTTDMLQGLDDE